MKCTIRFRSRLYKKYLLSLSVLMAVLVFGDCAKPPKIYKIGILSGLDYFANTAAGFKERMAEFGYAEGKNIIYDVQKTNYDTVREIQILKRFISDHVDLVVTFPTEVSLSAKKILQETAIILIFANANIEGVPLVKSILEPGRNITGVRYPGPDIALKRFEILHEVLPHARRVLIPYQREYPIVPSQLEVLRPVASAAGVTLIELPVSSAEELQIEIQKLAQIPKTAVDAILMISEPLMVTQAGFRIAGKYASEHKIPIGGAWISMEGYRSLWGVSTNNRAVGRQAASLAEKILKGIPAGNIPVVSAESHLQINSEEAQKLGLTIPEGLLKQADEVIH